ncbi:ATP-binding cassette domain-containing protein [Ferrimonas marina]|uniref:Cationic peptide transport system ATP-binding protein n=1 Tax=Ferrimonas marina TaxID=299255 RepID=A0A1M5Y8H4_9GAMM|nr:ATP-binding cassette domain-containing protein [Ferrimonas marina]SHI08375.1 cationic peptide transport system ATP-binding protein [Ferrimonas marina]
MIPLLQVRDLHKHYRKGRRLLRTQYKQALAPISFDLYAGETLAFVGEAGSGRSTLAQILAGAKVRSGGQILLEGSELDSQDRRRRAKEIRMIFQDPTNSLNPRLRIGEQLEEPLLFNSQLNKEQRQQAVEQALVRVGMLREHTDFYPQMLAHGQRQRIAIARALILEPKILIADEAFAGLDTSLRAQCVNLMLQLQRQMGLAYVMMSHDLGLVRHMSDRVIVMKKGQVVEQGETEQLFTAPQHDYTKRLLDEQLIQFKH